MSENKPQQAKPDMPATLPPYGYMNATWTWDVKTRRVPVGFMIDGRAATAIEWADYLDKEVSAMAGFLWPRFDFDQQTWIGDAKKSMHTLSLADLDLMDELRSTLFKAPKVEGKDVDATHLGMFEPEDETPPGAPLYPTLDLYVPKLSAEALSGLKAAIKKMSVDFGPAPLRYKEYFQRPRPFQVSFMFKRRFEYEFGHSAVSPSMISGHCMQGMVRHAAGYLAHRRLLEKTPGAVQGLLQHAADYGDRRVYAGVHYPSDNIGSWYCSLRLCDHLYGDAGQPAKEFIVRAIRSSAVWGRLQESIMGSPDSPFAIPMKRLADEADRPATTPEP